MKLKATPNLTLSGVMQGLGGAEENRCVGSKRDVWAIPLINTDEMSADGWGKETS
jgi:hypothetical protein